MQVCPHCGETNADRARFCQACGSPLAPVVAPSSVRKTVTILFSDVAGSTSIGERLDPESVRRLMGRYFDEMREVLERHGGTVEKFIGDAVMAVFGIPRVHEDDALRAVRAADAMRERLVDVNADLLDGFGVELSSRTGIHTGEVAVGDPDAGQTLVTGDAVNTAARLEQAAGSGEILLGGTTHALVRDAVVAEPVAAYRLDEVLPGAEAHARRFDAPMIGRENELGAILDSFRRTVADRTCRVVTLLGEAGVGKSRLAFEAIRAFGVGAEVLRGRCLPYGEGITFWPIAEVVRQAAGIADDDEPAEARRRIVELLEQVDHSDRIAEGVTDLIGLGAKTRSAEEGFWAARRFFEGLARRRPVVLVLDDIQWGEETFLDLLSYVLEWTDGVPVFLLCLARKELLDRRPGWAATARSEVLALEPLDDTDCVGLLRGLLDTDDVPAEVTSAIAGTAEGNPLFVEEIVGMLIDDGLLVRENGRWSAAPGLAGISIPPTVHALLAGRLEQLEAPERRVLEGASVIGEVFEWSAVAELVPTELRPGLGGHLMSLVRKDVIRPAPSDLSGEDAFRFRHLLIRDAAYDGMGKEGRAELHVRFARWLRDAAPERLPELQPIVGYHLERAVRYRQELGAGSDVSLELAREAAGHLGEAGRRALARADVPAAENLLGRAVALLPPDEPLRPQLTIALAEALWEMGEFDRVEELADDGAAHARTIGDRSLELRFELRRLYLRLMRDPKHVLLRDIAAEAEAIAAEAGELDDPLTEGSALLRAGRLYGDIGRSSDGERTVARASECFARAGVLSAELAFVRALSFAYQGPHTISEDIELGERALAEAEPTSPFEAFALLSLAVSRAMIAEFEEARSLIRRAASILEELGMTVELAAACGLTGGVVELAAGDPVAAEAAVRPAYEALAAMGEKARLSSRAGILASAVYEQGRLDEAIRLADEADAVSAADDLEPQVWLRGVRAKALARLGRFDEAERGARENVDLIEPTEWLPYRGMAWFDLGEVLRLAGQHEEAAAAFRTAEDLQEQKGSTVMAARARAARAAIEASS